MGRVQHPIVIVVSPLIALLEDQIREAGKIGCYRYAAGRKKQKRCQLVFGSPESWLNEKWRSMLASEVYLKNLVGFVVDEPSERALLGWENSGSIVKGGTPVMALTASADIVNRGRLTKLLHMEKATQITQGSWKSVLPS
ncbi:unnamed protein product [Arctogadus glacialis]